ncbi:hypothetical protein QBC34DRAFT_302709, partial [Podospora aff. communis PSN243]
MSVPSLSERWPRPEESVGREIQTRRIALLRSKKVWWASGPAMAVFDEDIQPAIDSALRNVDACHYDIDLRLYMMGRKKESSRPIIFICCADGTVRRDAEECVRKSGILRKHPGFGLGASPLPLEGFSKVLSGHDVRPEARGTSDGFDVFAQEEVPIVGRKLWARVDPNGPFLRRGTGGVVLVVDGQHYQITAGHIRHDEPIANWDDLHFDGQSDDEESESETSMVDIGSTSEGSRTPQDIVEQRGSDSSPSTLSEAATEEFGHSSQGEIPGRGGDASLKYAGTIRFSGEHLDYALVNIPEPEASVDLLNRFRYPTHSLPTPIRIRSVADIPNQEKPVVVITASQGAIVAALRPSFAYVRPAGSNRFQKTHIMEVAGEIAPGDSGSPVVDGSSGDLYGSMVRGCPGSRNAYVLSANTIFESI